MVSCAWCGTIPEPDSTRVPLTWTTSVENGTTRYLCESCTRENVRGIEGKLDSAWW
ncbi:MAG: hypothetical protein ACRDYU_00960 [Actinomycetes bacterium]